MVARAAVVAALLLLLPPAAAFGSVPPGESAHDLITQSAALPLGFTQGSLSALQEAIRRVDFDESKLDEPGGPHFVILDAGADYSPSHHCDRVPPMPDQHVLEITLPYIQLTRADALLWIRSDHPERAMRALGNALHALQDCFSHSDIVDRPPEMQATYSWAVVHGVADAVEFPVHFTGLQPGAEQAEFPPGDPYPHGRFAKDGENFTTDAAAILPDGRTKYAAAYALAANATEVFLREFLENVTFPQKQALFDTESIVSPERLSLPFSQAVAAVLVAAVAQVRRLRRDGSA